ncbi:cystathionine beta-synthase [Aequorivita sp. H23M31]|uniref:Cystathionine beta-synthase n=1 Tax=Aequorivita ciconiae TaxID=2494375 RepID=A0A410G3K5_9FLAO|nr:PLP-dependent transferase [Aequorivita sp. H23M31]QAA81846.1 cystathionine beta-synthase [Aequorivita sp. H23M31]
MKEENVLNYIKNVLENVPKGWLDITTHRLDIYNEELAKTEFLEQFENLYEHDIYLTSALEKLPTAYDYIRLGHPLSCVLEWAIAKLNELDAENVIAFSSQTIPVMAILRTILLANKNTQIVYTDKLPDFFDIDVLEKIYGYKFELKKVSSVGEIASFDGSTIFISQTDTIENFNLLPQIDFYVHLHPSFGSILLVNGEQNQNYISEIQHVRRRETIAMTPANCFTALQILIGKSSFSSHKEDVGLDKKQVLDNINQITGVDTKPLVASSGLSIQYAIMMGLIDDAQETYKGKKIKFIVPPNCYGGTNDQARRVAACFNNVEIVDLLVDRENDMVQSLETILTQIAHEDAIPYIIAEIPTNPRVEVPDLEALKDVLGKKRKTAEGNSAIEPVFILDQTFCPNYHFLGNGEVLSEVRALSYASGSKFPSGGRCTAGYCVANAKTADLMGKIEKHLALCDNEATALQYKILAEQLPSMNERIKDAYKNTREFVTYIHTILPDAKINFVSEELAEQGFTPSVFSLDLPTKGNSVEEKEAHKRQLNLKLINKMISEIPSESKFCVSYGQLKGCYWTIPATSTQGTTKEGDKDYIVRVSVSPNLNLDLHKKVFFEFVQEM